MKTTIAVKGMKCGGCEVTVREAVGACAGVIAVAPDHKANSVEVEYGEARATLEEIKQVIAGKGFQVG
jgi:copper chaperone